VPLILQDIFDLLNKSNAELAIEVLDSLKISNEMFKEHMMDLCMSKKVKE